MVANVGVLPVELGIAPDVVFVLLGLLLEGVFSKVVDCDEFMPESSAQLAQSTAATQTCVTLVNLGRAFMAVLLVQLVRSFACGMVWAQFTRRVE